VVIRSAVPDRRDHALEPVQVGALTVQRQNAGNSTHV
jgi:hypothetical protein